MKPTDYRARRTWQNEARARGEIPECGREACHRPADPAWVNRGTPLLYCAECGQMINRLNPEIVPPLCRPETPPAPESLGLLTSRVPAYDLDYTIPLSRAQRRARGDYRRADNTVRRTR